MKKTINKMLVVALALASFGLMGCEPSKDAEGPENIIVKDADGNKYPTVKIGKQVWMAKNLNVKVPGSVCYDNKDGNCKKYGRLYTWEAAKNACPSGWHLPSTREFRSLLATLGASYEASYPYKYSFKEQSLNLRADSWENGVDKFGFSALPAGYYNSNYKEFYYIGSSAWFWSSSNVKKYADIAAVLSLDDRYATIASLNKQTDFNSVRCLQDSNDGGETPSLRSQEQPSSMTAGKTSAGDMAGTLKDSRDGQIYKTVKIGTQVWMAENLNYETSESECYEFKESNCKMYGSLYTWDEALNACPAGWHLPSRDEFEMLLATVGYKDHHGTKNLRADSWKNGVDKFGFSALPAGYCNDGYSCRELGSGTFFWTSTEIDSDHAYDLFLDDVFGANFEDLENVGKDHFFSVRCLKD